MSAQSRHFLRLWFYVLARLERCERNPRVDREIFEDEHRVRMLAAELIGYGVSPENEPVCGEPKADASGRFPVNPLPAFCQAGVVAPPDSLMDEKSRSEWETAFHGERFHESQLMSGDR